jgi:hypothetical protein
MANSDSAGSGDGLAPLLIAACLTACIGLGVGFVVATMMTPATQEGAGAALPPGLQAQTPPQAGKPTEHGATTEGAHGESADSEAPAENAAPAEEPIDLSRLVYASIPPVIVNLREQSSSWVRVEGGVLYLTDGELTESAVGPFAAEITMNYLRTLTVKDFGSADSLQLIKMDLSEISKSLSNGQIRSFLFTSFIVE